MKTIKQLLITVAMLLCIVTANAYDFEVNGVYYNIISSTDLTAEVTSGAIKYSGDIVIPSTVEFRNKQLSVIKVGTQAFKECSELISITIEEGITEIGYEAFCRCYNLEDVELPQSLKEIDIYSFAYCDKLTEAPLHEGIEHIDSYAFYDCDGLTDISIPRSVYSVGYDSFGKCDNIKTVFIPRNIIKYNSIFKGCPNLETIKIEGAFPPEISYSFESFEKEITLNSTLYVSKNAAEQYRNTLYWKDFFAIEEDESLGECSYIDVTCSDNGSVEILGQKISNNSTPVKLGGFNGDSISITFIPDNYSKKYRVKSFLLNGVETVDEITNNSYSFVLSSNTTIYIEYVRYYNLTITSEGDEGTVYVNGNAIYNETKTLIVDEGTRTEMHIELAEGYRAKAEQKGYYSGFTQLNDSTFVLSPAYDLNVTFTYSKIHIQLYSTCKGKGVFYTNDKGVTEKSNYLNTGCYYFDNINLKCIPEQGYHLASLLIDSTEVADKVINNEYNFISKSNKEIRMICTFDVNFYLITYVIDGVTYKTQTVKYGAEILPIDEPTKEGYTFNGWSEIPATMPAEDITIKGSFTVNSYNVQFVIDEEVYETATIEYGAEIELPSVPEKEGHTFSGWENVPETMPAKDIVIQGHYTVDTAIEEIYLDLENIEVYNLRGVRITETDKLTRGIYIINGNKTFVK